MSVPYLGAELPHATWHHEIEVNFETLLASVVLRAVACSPCRTTPLKDTPARSLPHHVASLALGHCVPRSLPSSAALCMHVELAPCGVCIVSCRAVTTERLPSSELELINDNQWRRLFPEIVRRPSEHGISGNNVNDGILICLQWALDETPLQYCPKERRMQVAD